MSGHRKFTGRKLVVASHNPGKIREIGELLAAFDVEPVSAGSLGLPEPVEDGDSFIANAEIKALAAARGANMIALSDDSGFALEALDGAPGIYSARWAGPSKDFTIAMQKVEDELQKAGAMTPDARRARFICALTLAWPDGHVESFEGTVTGTAVWPPRGENGFGYDPVFLPDGYDLTFGEMDAAAKHAMSHRADAFRQLINACFTEK
ncbi:MAG: non-canonical purine NTP pyrophosphatase, RdgB/HAM1 family [Sneathiella sp.]|uniref:RdgB/HAM1 family non-canonical purine NTP pyrophosphatase n=1 Tax=Sneathiella sp. TaxID=1964365 RepID=UPI000C5D3F7E|nr:RdgB/HAM1 family non-canonical purine NTP pyrophosphatase [Sneathiella sp.]MAL79372.1 non-canonical purine NTP pyrophosphatase, RdgB/HAM1 family [Sneathiella sp.]